MYYPRYDEDGNYITDPPQSRIEERLNRIEQLIREGGGGDAETATPEDIQNIKDHTWGDTDTTPETQEAGSGEGNVEGGGADLDDLDETATASDIQAIKDGIWGD